jgi:hypothetical protein
VELFVSVSPKLHNYPVRLSVEVFKAYQKFLSKSVFYNVSEIETAARYRLRTKDMTYRTVTSKIIFYEIRFIISRREPCEWSRYKSDHVENTAYCSQ